MSRSAARRLSVPTKAGRRQLTHEDERWFEQPGAFGDENMKGEDVYDNRTEHEKAEIPCAGNGDEDTVSGDLEIV